MTHLLLRVLSTALALVLAGCATHVDLAPDEGQPALRVQQRLALTPSNGGLQITPDDLRAGDIVLSSTHSIVSMGVRLITVAPVSHAALYLGDGQFVEAVGAGVRLRSTQEYMDGESTIVALRHPGVGDEHIAALNAFARQHAGKKYNTAGIVLQAPFSIGRQYCELPLIPGLVRDYCIRGLAAIQLGAVKNDRFFCSQFVLEAYRHARLPLTTADPRLISPADLLHMREGDVPSVRTEQALQYVGHLKTAPMPSDEMAVGLAD
ncbi:YiiX/YebB-like N1pC/P60 family cysteine hydrolase [Hydrogenophaga sp. NH-16]|uniref:YiiX/YebB-like N1pC/P60 family cysteine hydrolase n=1 Tax=Hydrogenophaga sp. NH-16 TaxID=2184519 RepID=UPI000FDAF9F9|nr:YiiX/YebB-like N1pC/P60 family cysteine hydrolase [Hydrogenophaga sp. NH-16]